MPEWIRKPIDVNEQAGYILDCLKKGILMSTKSEARMDTMTIGWGALGIDWSLPVFTAYVRDSRFTKVLLDQSGEFTVNIPLEGSDVRKIISFCGTKSGRDVNKFAELDLHAIQGETVKAPAIAELPLTLECRVLYAQKQDPEKIPASILSRHYPQQDYHTAYTAEITAAYILEEQN